MMLHIHVKCGKCQAVCVCVYKSFSIHVFSLSEGIIIHLYLALIVTDFSKPC